MLIEVFSNNLDISEFGYSGVYYITKEEVVNNIDMENLIYTGNRIFFVNDGEVYVEVLLHQQRG